MARLIFSLTGLVPLGLWMVIELWLHAAALAGPLAYASRLERILSLPGAWALGALVVAGLSVHAGLGIVLALRPELNVVRLGHARGWMFVLERLSALALLFFIAAHAALFWWPLAAGDLAIEAAHATWVRRLSATSAGVPWAALGYAFGMAAAAYHLAYGAFTAALRWGFLTTGSSRRRGGPAFGFLGVSLFAAGFLPILHLATGDRVFDKRRLEADVCAVEAR